MAERERLGSDDRQGLERLTPPRQDVEDYIVAGGSGFQCLPDRILDPLQPIGEHRREHPHEPAVGFIAGPGLAAKPGQRRRQLPVLERRAVPQRARLLGQHR